MQPTVNALRAIGIEFIRRTVRPFIFIGTAIALIAVTLGAWLTTYTVWWWILEAILIGGFLLYILLVLVVYAILRKVSSPLSKPQKRAVTNFVDKLERVADNLQTPQITIMYYVLRDIIRPRLGGFIETVSKDSKTLAPDFTALRKEFERP